MDKAQTFPLYLPVTAWQINHLMTYLDAHQKKEPAPQQALRKRLENHGVSLQARLIDLSIKHPDLTASGIINKEIIICYNNFEKETLLHIITGLKTTSLKKLLQSEDPIANLDLTFEYHAWCKLITRLTPPNLPPAHMFQNLLH